MTHDLVSLANAIKSLSWRDMVKVSEHIADSAKALSKDDLLDRDSMAQTFVDIADDILTEYEKDKAAKSGGAVQ